jgi:hypothetical protein
MPTISSGDSPARRFRATSFFSSSLMSSCWTLTNAFRTASGERYLVCVVVSDEQY